jgi:hypothetical protein
MSVTIGELEVETRESPAQPKEQSGASKPQNSCELRTAMERLRERDLRLQAD